MILQGRVPWASAAPMSEAQRELVDVITRDWGTAAIGLNPIDADGRVLGPFDLMLADPAVGSGLLGLLEAFRHAQLTVIERELVILAVAAGRGSGFMWHAHASALLNAGGDPALLSSIAARKPPVLGEGLDALYRLTHELVSTRDVDDEMFAEATEKLGPVKVQAAVWLVGVYEMFALAMRVARTPDPQPTTVPGDAGGTQ